MLLQSKFSHPYTECSHRFLGARALYIFFNTRPHGLGDGTKLVYSWLAPVNAGDVQRIVEIYGINVDRCMFANLRNLRIKRRVIRGRALQHGQTSFLERALEPLEVEAFEAVGDVVIFLDTAIEHYILNDADAESAVFKLTDGVHGRLRLKEDGLFILTPKRAWTKKGWRAGNIALS